MFESAAEEQVIPATRVDRLNYDGFAESFVTVLFGEQAAAATPA